MCVCMSTCVYVCRAGKTKREKESESKKKRVRVHTIWRVQSWEKVYKREKQCSMVQPIYGIIAQYVKHLDTLYGWSGKLKEGVQDKKQCSMVQPIYGIIAE